MDEVRIEVNGQQRVIHVTAGMGAVEINAGIAAAFPHVPPEQLPRALTSAEQKAHQERYERERRTNLIATIRSYHGDDIKAALAFVKRKGWGSKG